jgi:TRAP-type C4-dicarboxylate transport system permease large subunit
MERGRVAEKLFDFAEAVVGWLPGGLGHVNVASSVIFGGVSGSSVADIASIGAIEIKAMERHGFPKGYAVGLTLCTSVLSSIIPPSILIVIAGSIANVSIGTLLVAGSSSRSPSWCSITSTRCATALTRRLPLTCGASSQPASLPSCRC